MLLTALAAPPVNDNYLASLPVDKIEFRSTVDLTEATTQPDIFNPSRDGQPLGGGTTENTVCKGTPFGKTAWFDLTPQSDGAIDVSAAGTGFTPVIVLYEWSQANSQITRMVDCTPVAGGRLALDVKKGRSYTIQLGGAGGIGGPATLSVDYFADTRRRRRVRRARQVPGGRRASPASVAARRSCAWCRASASTAPATACGSRA